MGTEQAGDGGMSPAGPGSAGPSPRPRSAAGPARPYTEGGAGSGGEVLLAGWDGAGAVRRTVLPGGIRVVTESIGSVRSVSLGVWVGVGSRDEGPGTAGASHYLEHLLFKGTPRRSALDITAAIEAAGGDINAFTAKDHTCYYARVLDSDLPLAAEVITDVVASALLRAEDVESERGVILEEIAMTEDDPGDLVHDEFAAALFGDTPLGRPIAGTAASVNALTRDAIADYYRTHYRGPNLVVAAAGNLEHDRVVELVQAGFAAAAADSHLSFDPTLRPLAVRELAAARPGGSGVRLLHRKTEQAHLVLGTAGVSRGDDRRWALGVLAAVLGGGMSSRLFQEIREKRGLAYSVYCYASQYADAGSFGVYAGCQPKKLKQVLALCREELAKIVTDGITEPELRLGIGQLRGGMVLGLEDTGSRMSRIGKSELVYGEHLSVDTVLDRLAAVTRAEVAAVAADLLTAEPAVAVIGPYKDASSFLA
ncbi:MAG TPA: pitrilysin family protein [Actinocrinis sp.]|nr:pitrilysin family protein [Actinocrinis sp.]